MIVRRHVLALALGCGALFPIGVVAQTPPSLSGYIASPAPSFDHPRKIVLSLSEKDPERVNEVIGNLGNIQRFYGADNVRLALVLYGPGIHAVLKDDSAVRARIAGLVAIGVEVLACNATLQSLHKTAADLLPDVRIVPNGIPEIVERETDGWIYVRP